MDDINLLKLTNEQFDLAKKVSYEIRDLIKKYTNQDFRNIVIVLIALRCVEKAVDQTRMTLLKQLKEHLKEKDGE